MAKQANEAAAEMTAAEAAKRVKRLVMEKAKDGTVVEKKLGVSEAEVLAFRDYGDYVRVVTTDGQKLDSRDC